MAEFGKYSPPGLKFAVGCWSRGGTAPMPRRNVSSLYRRGFVCCSIIEGGARTSHCIAAVINIERIKLYNCFLMASIYVER